MNEVRESEDALENANLVAITVLTRQQASLDRKMDRLLRGKLKVNADFLRALAMSLKHVAGEIEEYVSEISDDKQSQDGDR